MPCRVWAVLLILAQIFHFSLKLIGTVCLHDCFRRDCDCDDGHRHHHSHTAIIVDFYSNVSAKKHKTGEYLECLRVSGWKMDEGKSLPARWSIGMREKARSVTCAEIWKWSFLMHCRCVASRTDPANLERRILGKQMTVYSLEVAQKCVPRLRLACFKWNICHTRRCYIACRLQPKRGRDLTMIHTPTRTIW